MVKVHFAFMSNCAYMYLVEKLIFWFLNFVHVGLALHTVLIRTLHYMPCAINFSRGFWYCTSPCCFIFDSTKLLAASEQINAIYHSQLLLSIVHNMWIMKQLAISITCFFVCLCMSNFFIHRREQKLLPPYLLQWKRNWLFLIVLLVDRYVFF